MDLNLTESVSDFFSSQVAVSKAALKAEKELEDYYDSLIETETYTTCDWCGEAITDDWYEIDRDIICPDCIDGCRKERQ